MTTAPTNAQIEAAARFAYERDIEGEPGNWETTPLADSYRDDARAMLTAVFAATPAPNIPNVLGGYFVAKDGTLWKRIDMSANEDAVKAAALAICATDTIMPFKLAQIALAAALPVLEGRSET